MKKLLFLFVLFLTFSQATFAQHAKGDFNLNIGIGLLPVFGTGNAVLPPIGASGEYGITDDISVGGYLAFATYKEDFEFFNGKWKYSYIIIGPRASYHLGNVLDLPDAWDPYAGAFLGYTIGSSKWDGDGTVPTSTSIGGFGWSGHLGTRYQVSDNLRLFGELGYGISVLQLGISLKL
ncbi:MAG: outer membrane beta-barrel protein [Haliscomenobacter sp.]|nr:outer membrane beta-barrel protein [Haliscomenobacter sp.]